jgi:intracellular sulfur oxidation DsrE/DsrF family protein
MTRAIFLFFVSLFAGGLAQADNQGQIHHILKQEVPPFGVVFEVVEGDRDALEWAIPQIKKFSEQLRKKFPDIGIAVVSHGKEQFALMKNGKQEFNEVHTSVQSLVKNDIPVHICGTHASWYGKKASDFPDYIDVAPAGPTQIRDYEDMGYSLIVLDEP